MKNFITCSMRFPKAASFLVGKNEHRFYIRGVCTQSTTSRTRLISTDRHMLLMIDEEKNNHLEKLFVEIIIS